LIVSILAILSGAKGYTDIARFAQMRLPELKEHFEINWKRGLHFSTIRKVFVKINPEQLEGALRLYSQSLLETKATEGKCALCFDGKALKGGFSHVKDRRASYVFRRFHQRRNSY